MDYKDKYNKLVNVIKVLQETNPSDEGIQNWVKDNVPELTESEDSQVRKEMLSAIRQFDDDSSLCGKKYDYRKWIAWLEKQGKETSWKPSKEEMDVLYGLAYITNQYDEHKEEVITRLYQDLKREFFNGSSYENMFPTNTSTEDDVRRRSTIQVLEYARSLDAYNQFGKADIDKNITWLEKQGKSNRQTVLTLPKFTLSDVLALQCCMETVKKVQEDKELYEKLNYLHSKVYDSYQLEKQGEQSTDKIEPKFKPADWSEDDEKHMYHISDFIMRNRVGDTDAIYRLEQDVVWLKSIKERMKGE